MEKLIENVLEEYRHTNLHSAAGRQAIVRSIMKQIRSDDSGGFYLNLNSIDGTIPETGDDKEEAKWVCEHCGQNTFHIDYDYIGSNYNHLGCELKAEDDRKPYINDNVDETDKDKKVDWFGNVQKQAYNEMTADGLPSGGDAQAVLESHKLAEEIVDNHGEKWIYESPDGGKTVFRRPFGDYDMKNKEEINWETKEPTGRKFTEYPYDDGK